MAKLINYLRQYFKVQEKIMVVYHPTAKSSWRDRCLFMSDEYDQMKQYNHRSILDDEVVIEFDLDDPDVNKKYADVVCKRLTEDNIDYAKWKSGNKSTHVHFFLDFKSARNIQLLKKCVIRHYAQDLPLPDLRLAGPNHLIRAEYGIHEKTGRYKSLISKTKNFINKGKIIDAIWERYVKEQEAIIRRRTTVDLRDLESLPGFQYILSSHDFKDADDGRERALFMLIHLLKKKFATKEECIKYMQEWYRYSGGRKLSEFDIKNKVHYHWFKSYTIGEQFLNELLESIGRGDLIQGTTNIINKTSLTNSVGVSNESRNNG